MPELLPPTKRLFVAVDPPSAVSGALARLDPGWPGVRWQRPGKMHLTLVFLGNVPSDTEVTLRAEFAAVALAPFTLAVRGMGTFRGRRLVLWAGVTGELAALTGLRDRVQAAVVRTGLPGERGRFHPHFTLAYNPPPREAARFVADHAGLEAGEWTVNGFALYSSKTRHDGAVYTREAWFPATG